MNFDDSNGNFDTSFEQAYETVAGAHFVTSFNVTSESCKAEVGPYALFDLCATSMIIGDETLDEIRKRKDAYVKILSERQSQKTITCNGTTGKVEVNTLADLFITFGDIAGNVVQLKATALVVPGSCPLLVSKRELQAMNANIDCVQGRILINHNLDGPGGKHTLRCTKAPTGLWCKFLVPKFEKREEAHVNVENTRKSPRLQQKFAVPVNNQFEVLGNENDVQGRLGNGRGPRRGFQRGRNQMFRRMNPLPPQFNQINYPPLQRV